MDWIWCWLRYGHKYDSREVKKAGVMLICSRCGYRSYRPFIWWS